MKVLNENNVNNQQKAIMSSARIKKTLIKIVSILLPCLMLSGGIAIVILVEKTIHPPIVKAASLKIMILIFTCSSLFLSSLISIAVVFLKHRLWLSNFQVAVQSVMLIAALTALLAFNDAVYFPENDDCTSVTNKQNFTTCVCGEEVTEVRCESIFEARDTGKILVIVFITVLILCLLDIIKALTNSCLSDDEELTPFDKEVPTIQEQIFYTIPHKKPRT